MPDLDLPQRIRDRLDGLLEQLEPPEHGRLGDLASPQPLPRQHSCPAVGRPLTPVEVDAWHTTWPAAFLELSDDDALTSAADREAWQKRWDALLADSATHSLVYLPTQRIYPGNEQMRDAILAVLELHQPESVDYVSVDHEERTSVDCSECDTTGTPDSWPCATLKTIACKLGIEAADA